MITQNADDVPFDVKHIRLRHYTFTPRGMADFENTLDTTIRNVLGLGDGLTYQPSLRQGHRSSLSGRRVKKTRDGKR